MYQGGQHPADAATEHREHHMAPRPAHAVVPFLVDPWRRGRVNPRPGWIVLPTEETSSSGVRARARCCDRGSAEPGTTACQDSWGQLGQSRMKTDETTLAAGYGAIGGFNLRQLIRHLLGQDIKPME
jgi:hypothetical protein